MKKVVLAFSGGLDTTYCAIHLSKEKGMEVHAVLVNTGGFSTEEVAQIEKHAFDLGVASFVALDESVVFYQSVIKYLVYGNVLKNNTYPLSVSAERIVQAIAIAKHAKSIGAEAIAHGSTGAGNDQIRFDMVFQTMTPEMEVITPIRDNKLSRQQEIDFLKSHGVEMNFEKSVYSINKGIWGTSIGGKETLTSNQYLPEEAFSPITKSGSEDVELVFEKGELVGVNGTTYDNSVDAILALEALAHPYGIGRDIHVGDTIIGIKGRVGFEAAAPSIIIKAHHLLEKHILTKWQLFWKDQLSDWYGNWLHEGQFLDPVMRDIESFMAQSQDRVSGKVFVTLSPEKFRLNGIESKYDLMRSEAGQYGEMNNGWTDKDVKGFAKIFGNQSAIYHSMK